MPWSPSPAPPNTVAIRQWISELRDKTTLEPDQVGEYSGLTKEIRPVTRDTVDQSFATNRQRFLTEQGYKDEILYENEVLNGK
jgi:DNA excision repair protein ERCC-3